MSCCVDDCCGPGSYCCEHANPHTHDEEDTAGSGFVTATGETPVKPKLPLKPKGNDGETEDE